MNRYWKSLHFSGFNSNKSNTYTEKERSKHYIMMASNRRLIKFAMYNTISSDSADKHTDCHSKSESIFVVAALSRNSYLCYKLALEI